MTISNLLGIGMLMLAVITAALAARGLAQGRVRYLSAGPFSRADRPGAFWTLIVLWGFGALVCGVIGIFLLTHPAGAA